jgi:hypothetical protein
LLFAGCHVHLDWTGFWIVSCTVGIAVDHPVRDRPTRIELASTTDLTSLRRVWLSDEPYPVYRDGLVSTVRQLDSKPLVGLIAARSDEIGAEIQRLGDWIRRLGGRRCCGGFVVSATAGCEDQCDGERPRCGVLGQLRPDGSGAGPGWVERHGRSVAAGRNRTVTARTVWIDPIEP